jgi:hypothetical protein
MNAAEMRRIVTANDESGKSYVLSDSSTPHVLSMAPDAFLIDFWAATPTGPLADGDDGVVTPMQLYPPRGGSTFRFFQIPSERTMTEARMKAAFDAIDAGHAQVNTARHPGMHLTQTLDYIVVLNGELKLILDKGEVHLKPFDVVIQRQTNHAWVNLGEEPVLCVGVLIDRSDTQRE